MVTRARMTDALDYLTGFGGHFATEAVPGALPKGRNSPQRPAFGLYAEQLSGSSFTCAAARKPPLVAVPDAADRRPPPVRALRRCAAVRARAGQEPLAPNRLRWDPPADLPEGKDFVDGMVTMLVNRSPEDLEGVAVHLYRASEVMERPGVRRCRRRAADHSAVGHAARRDRARPARSRAGLDRASSRAA